jgi:hypothetical protein
VDGVTTIQSAVPLAVGDIVTAVVTGSEGVDLTATVLVDDQTLAEDQTLSSR